MIWKCIQLNGVLGYAIYIKTFIKYQFEGLLSTFCLGDGASSVPYYNVKQNNIPMSTMFWLHLPLACEGDDVVQY